MIKNLIGLSGGGVGSTEITNTKYTRYMNPIVLPSFDSGALDCAQCFLLDVVDTGTEWYLYYAGANTDTTNYTPDGQNYTNNDATFLVIKTKSNDVKTGWTKFLDVNSDPKPVLKPSFVGGRFDYWQAWARTVIKEGANWKMWFVGDDGASTFDYRVGYATSSDGQTWTKSGTTPIYTDFLSDGGLHGIVVLRVVNNGTNYVMIYAGTAPDVDGLKVAQSADGITSWSVVTSGLFANGGYGFPSDFKYSGGTYYLWLQRGQMMPAGNLGPCREVVLFSSTNLTTWTNLGVQMKVRGSQECGIGNHVKVMQKPNGEWFMAHTYYINRTQALAGITKEPSTGIKIAEADGGSFIMNSQCVYSYPDNVSFHAPLGPDMGFTEVISGTTGTLSSGVAAYAERDFIRLTGSQVLTFSNNGSVIGAEHFAVKMRVQVLTTGTHELFRIGNDIIMSLESGKLRVRLSSDGAGYEKDYITSVNISKPAGIDYIDDHIYVGFMWGPSGTLRLFNDFVEFTAGEITETVDDFLATVNDSSSNILIGQNATLELRSVSVIDEPTDEEFINLDI
jgi:hypothetical protein